MGLQVILCDDRDLLERQKAALQWALTEKIPEKDRRIFQQTIVCIEKKLRKGRR